MKPKYRYSILILFGFAGLSLSFQNCTKIKAADLLSANDKMFAQDLEDDQNQDIILAAPSGTGGTTTPQTTQEDPITDEIEDIPDIDQATAVAACLNDSKRKITDAKEVIGLRGQINVEGDSIQILKDLRGHIVVKGVTSDSTLKLAQDIRGAFIICNLKVDSIEFTRGKIALVNSQVKSIKDHKGMVFLYNSSVDSSDLKQIKNK